MSDIVNTTDMINEIKEVLQNARLNISYQVNSELLSAYWSIGKIIIEHEQNNNERAEYGKQTLKELSKILTAEFGKGFSRSNLQNMRAFYQTYQKCQTLSGKLTWSHYCELLSIQDSDKRNFYEKECENSNWSVRELKRQISTSLYERLLLSDGNTNKETVLKLSQSGIEINTPKDIIKDPYVFEFLGIPENKPILENELEKALVNQIEKFLLELGRGFMFVGTQQRVTLNNTHYYVDMVFYNKILRAYVLIELKTTKLLPEAVGQLNMYLNYYATEINDNDDNEPIGIILCTDKDSIAAEYALGGLSNNIFASKYTYCIPNKQELIAQVEAVLNNFHDKEKTSVKDLNRKIEIFTDGACSGNPGPGGWGAILRFNGTEKELSGGEKDTTNNRMELTAVIKALEALKEPCEVMLTTDSKYVCDSITKGWVYSWQKNNWRKADKKPALNVDLWETLLPLLEKHKVTFKWVKGHNEHPENERCDKLAVSEYQRYI